MRPTSLSGVATAVSLLGLFAGTAAASAQAQATELAPQTIVRIDQNRAACFGGCRIALHYVSFSPVIEKEQLQPQLQPQLQHRYMHGGGLRDNSTNTYADNDIYIQGSSGPCINILARKALLRCAHEYCSLHVRDAGLYEVNQTCIKHGFTGFGRVELVVGPVRRAAYEQGGVWGEVVIPDADFFERGYMTEISVAYVEKYHRLYTQVYFPSPLLLSPANLSLTSSALVFMYWIAVVCMGTGYRLFGNVLTRRLSHPHPKTSDDETADDTAFVPQPAGPASWLRRFILLPAVFGYRKAQPFGWYTVPPRAQSVALAIFVALNVWVTVQGYYFTDKNIYFPTRQKQLWRYLSDRSGFVSYANFPLVWVFGLRNNLLLWLTGWDFGTYNNFHRWVARVATAQAVIHSVGYTVLVFIDGGWPYFFFFCGQFFWWTGEIATIGMCLVLAASLYWVRRNMYETFLMLHIILSAVILVCLWGHLTIFKHRINSVFWLCSLVWAGDRLGRTMRILAFNPCFWLTHARVSYSRSANILLLSVSCRNSLYQPKPGTFYYIYALNSRCFWESHPFTVATISFATGEASCYEDCTAPLLDTPKPNRKPTEILFLIRPYAGFTDRLKASALQGPREMRILIEGPYGHSIPLDNFTTSLFIVGGSGIAVPLSYLTHLLAAKRSVRIIWAVRESAFVSDVIERDLARLLSSLGGSVDGLSLEIYVTSGEVCHAATPPGVTLFRGRPAVDMEVQETVAGVGAGRLAVVACGPGVMADDARAAVVKAIARGYTQTEYFEDAFNW
ncbi:hypothetical protein Cpir12675_006377 [Ceratocystis pirilliformis]|uniref:FAD-binding FR-type domain-containing protein n=1 Tax=Ceratocystis pirilliformis TaxID=259994 RepID=A0ABR3YHT7_9PEZI